MNKRDIVICPLEEVHDLFTFRVKVISAMINGDRFGFAEEKEKVHVEEWVIRDPVQGDCYCAECSNIPAIIGEDVGTRPWYVVGEVKNFAIKDNRALLSVQISDRSAVITAHDRQPYHVVSALCSHQSSCPNELNPVLWFNVKTKAYGLGFDGRPPREKAGKNGKT